MALPISNYPTLSEKNFNIIMNEPYEETRLSLLKGESAKDLRLLDKTFWAWNDEQKKLIDLVLSDKEWFFNLMDNIVVKAPNLEQETYLALFLNLVKIDERIANKVKRYLFASYMQRKEANGYPFLRERFPNDDFALMLAKKGGGEAYLLRSIENVFSNSLARMSNYLSK